MPTALGLVPGSRQQVRDRFNEALRHLLGLTRRIDDSHAVGLFAGNLSEAEIDLLVIILRAAADAVSSMIVTSAGPRSALSEGQDQGAVREAVINSKGIDRAHRVDAEAASASLIGQGAVDKTVGNHPLARFEGWPDRLVDMVGTGGSEQQRLCPCAPAILGASQQELAAKYASRINAIFDHCDVLLTPTIGEPPVPVGKWDSRRGLWTLAGMTRRTGFTPPWNYLGNPAAAVPAGFTAEGLPLSVQLVGRPDDEDTLLSLAAQIEAERPWADRRPPIS